MSASRRRVEIFATREDILGLIAEVEGTTPVTYVRTGHFDQPAVQTFDSLTQVADLGSAPSGSSARSASYLVAGRPFVPAVRPVALARGGTKYAVDQGANPTSVFLCPGGLYEPRVLIAGTVGTISNHQASVQLYQGFLTMIRRLFRQVKSFRVGAGAARLLDEGARLTTNVRSPTLYDLSR